MKKKPDINKEIAPSPITGQSGSKLSQYELIREKNVAWQFQQLSYYFQKDLHGNKNYADAEFLVAKMDLTNEDAVDKA